jgi:hypothetical protein
MVTQRQEVSSLKAQDARTDASLRFYFPLYETYRKDFAEIADRRPAALRKKLLQGAKLESLSRNGN